MKQHIHIIKKRVLYGSFGIVLGLSMSTSLAMAASVAESQTDTTSTETKIRNENQLKARAELQQLRQAHKTQTKEKRLAFCEQHKASMDTRFSTLGIVAQRHLDTFNTVYSKVQAYQSTNKLNVSNYDQLVATATAARSNAQAAVDALKTLSGTTIDCSGDPASTVTTVKTSVKAAHDALKTYRTAVKNIISALKTAASETSTKP